MIINVRGPSGAGKSYLVMRVMEQRTDEYIELHYPGFKKPVGRLYRGLFVAGRYDVRSAGCDSVPLRNWPRDWLFEMLRERAVHSHVLFEGMAISNEVTRTARLGCHVIGLTTPADQCLASAKQRRDRLHVHPGPGIEARHRELERVYGRLRDAGVQVERLGREEALMRVVGLLQ